MQFLRGHRWWQTAVGTLLLTALLLFGGAHWVGRHRTQAERLVEDRQWDAARKSLAVYLRFYPTDAEARLLLARAFISDNTLVGEDKVYAALAQLGQISPNSAKIYRPYLVSSCRKTPAVSMRNRDKKDSTRACLLPQEDLCF